ncbi:MAG: amino acid ABC transporter permease [Rhabdochlamydiaceae bacterium]|nr:amino acid ABC transporter permease [Rhabdochlamydiaceae bacterium]
MMNNYTEFLFRSYPLFAQGMWMTIKLVISASIISLILGVIFGSASSKRLKIRGFSALIETVTFIFRSVPFYVQLLIAYFVLPTLLKIDLSPFLASTFALGICSSAYVCQIIRSGINAIPATQWESAFSLGYGLFSTLRTIIFPQVLRNVLPALNNELEALLKSTAIAASIGLLELTRMGMNLVSREMMPIEVYLTLALFYLCLSGLFQSLSRYFERRLCNVKN